jgi:hypothetical protein
VGTQAGDGTQQETKVTYADRSRREFLKLGGGAAACAALGVADAVAAGEPTLGLIFPPLNYPIPPDATRLYPSGVRFIGNGVGLPGGMTVEGYEEAIPRVLPAARELAMKGANVVSVFGSSITFYKGRKFHEDLIAQVARATGVPATTQSAGLLDGLRTINARRVAVATAYTDVVTERLKIFLEEHDFVVTATKGLGFERIPAGAATSTFFPRSVPTPTPDPARRTPSCCRAVRWRRSICWRRSRRASARRWSRRRRMV